MPLLYGVVCCVALFFPYQSFASELCAARECGNGRVLGVIADGHCGDFGSFTIIDCDGKVHRIEVCSTPKVIDERISSNSSSRQATFAIYTMSLDDVMNSSQSEPFTTAAVAKMVNKMFDKAEAKSYGLPDANVFTKQMAIYTKNNASRATYHDAVSAAKYFLRIISNSGLSKEEQRSIEEKFLPSLLRGDIKQEESSSKSLANLRPELKAVAQYFMEGNRTSGQQWKAKVNEEDGSVELSNGEINSVKLPIENRRISVKDQSVAVYPNPVHSQTTLKFTTPLDETTVVTVQNSLGFVVKEQQIGKGSMVASIDLSEVNSGVYYIQYKRGNRYYQQPITVQH